MESALKKNLIYFIYWDPKSLMLDFNIRFLRKYIGLFNGQKIIKIAVDGVKPPKYLIKELNAEIVPNDPILNEAPHFKESLSRLTNDGITFYAHAKGISREPTGPLIKWVKFMYKVNLGSTPDLRHKIFSGTLGKLRRGSDQVPVPWHYTGSFYWFRNDVVLERYLNTPIPKEIDNRWFTENFPGWIADVKEAEFKIYASAEKSFNPYSEKFWIKNKNLLKCL
jgi:hypothetical protein